MTETRTHRENAFGGIFFLGSSLFSIMPNVPPEYMDNRLATSIPTTPNDTNSIMSILVSCPVMKRSIKLYPGRLLSSLLFHVEVVLAWSSPTTVGIVPHQLNVVTKKKSGATEVMAVTANGLERSTVTTILLERPESTQTATAEGVLLSGGRVQPRFLF